MDPARVAVRATIALVVLTTLASGPAVPGVDLTEPVEDGITFEGPDEIDASVVSLPTDDIRIEQGRYGAGTYYLRVPDAVVAVDRVRGSPRLVYKINIDQLGYVRATVHFVERTNENGRVSLALEEDTFEPDRIDRSEYEAVLSIVARSDEGIETLASQNVTVEVRS